MNQSCEAQIKRDPEFPHGRGHRKDVIAVNGAAFLTSIALTMHFA